MPLRHYGEDAPRPLSDIVLEELSMSWCRESGLLAPCAVPVPMGAVLGMDGEGRYVPYMADISAAAASIMEEDQEDSGPQTQNTAKADKAVAVLISGDLSASEETQPCTVIRRGARVAASNLYWLDGVEEEQKKTALSQLSALGIVPKE